KLLAETRREIADFADCGQALLDLCPARHGDGGTGPPRRYPPASNAVVICRGIRPGATRTASNRISQMRSWGYGASQAPAAAMMRARWRSVTDQAASS